MYNSVLGIVVPNDLGGCCNKRAVVVVAMGLWQFPIQILISTAEQINRRAWTS
jgi:hypothetical protein